MGNQRVNIINDQSNRQYLGTNRNNFPNYRNGCGTSEELFWKLDALQCFIRDLHWPDAEFRTHLEQRLKLMATDMMESCVQRTDAAFQVHFIDIRMYFIKYNKNVAFFSLV